MLEEEAEEVVRAAKSEGRTRTIEEAADVLYHLFVPPRGQQIELGDVAREAAAAAQMNGPTARRRGAVGPSVKTVGDNSPRNRAGAALRPLAPEVL